VGVFEAVESLEDDHDGSSTASLPSQYSRTRKILPFQKL